MWSGFPFTNSWMWPPTVFKVAKLLQIDLSYLIATNNRYDMKQTSSCFLCFSQALSFHFLGAERSIRASGLWEISWEEKKGHSVEWEVKGQFVSWCRLETDPRLGPRNWEELSSWVSESRDCTVTKAILLLSVSACLHVSSKPCTIFLTWNLTVTNP